jgi:hypothetical protein
VTAAQKIKGPVATRAPIEIADADRQWFSTERAAAYLDITVKALLKHVERRNIVPDVFGGRGRTQSHRFSRGTLDAFMRRGNAA